MTGKLLITGATGGLGLALVEGACAAGYDVVATGRSSRHRVRLESAGAQFIAADLTDPAQAQNLVEDCSATIHAAALSRSWGRLRDFQAANVDATRHLLEAARGARVTRFVYVSTPSIFAAFKDRLNIGQYDKPSHPVLNLYAHTKLAAERLVLKETGDALASIVVRPRAIVGPDDQVLLPKLASLAQRKTMHLPGGGRALIELTDVRDVASACLKALARADILSGQAFNISGGQPHRVADVAQQLAAMLGLQPKLVALPMPVAHFVADFSEAVAWLIGGNQEPVLTRYTLATLGYSQTFDLSPAIQRLDWSPRYDGLATLLAQAKRMSQ
jgi:2-alkyl-3-oxoalkanoate reductase